MSGIPTIIFDNGHGVAGEGLDLICTKDVDLIERTLRTWITTAQGVLEAHEISKRASTLFDNEVIRKQWAELLAGL
jgi:hypothetical protein